MLCTCSKRGSSTQADPELAMLRGKRIVIFQEPTKDEPMNVGKLKEWTGGDAIQTQELYKGPIKFKPQAKWFLICNDIPEVPSDDDVPEGLLLISRLNSFLNQIILVENLNILEILILDYI